MVDHGYDHNIRERVEKKAEMYLNRSFSIDDLPKKIEIMYVSEKDLKALCEALGMIDHEANCRGDNELAKLSVQLENLIDKAKRDIRKRKRK